MRTSFTVSLAALAVAMAAAPALADVFPVTGKWTYENAEDSGPAPICGNRTMEFKGERRFDKVGGVSDLRNVSVIESGPKVYQVVDEFFNAMIRGRVYYTLSVIDKDHIEIKLNEGGTATLLRRCLS
jgi:hypothetical protein